MASKEILKFGENGLKRVSKKVDLTNENITDLVQDLKDTLYRTTGIGLAAPQIGVLKRVILIDLREGDEAIILINPVIVAKVGKEESIEGCLSYPGYEGKLIRPKKITVQGLDTTGQKVEYLAEGLLAKAFCHEIDHLDGILYIDRAKKIYKVDER